MQGVSGAVGCFAQGRVAVGTTLIEHAFDERVTGACRGRQQ
jgi:hypothetical protein